MLRILVFIVILGIPQLSLSASFDCIKAKSVVEKLICSNLELSTLDEELNHSYQDQLSKIKNSGISTLPLVKDQRDWLNLTRNSCSDSDCLKHQYSQRLNYFQDFSLENYVANLVQQADENTLFLTCDYENNGISKKETVNISQILNQNYQNYVRSFDKNNKKPQHMKFQVSTGESASCSFPSGKIVKLKVGEGKARAYGQCGGDPEIFASIWIDRKKVISRRWFAGHCYEMFGQPLFSFTVQNDKAQICETFKVLDTAINADNLTQNCTPVSDIKKIARDAVEYPLPGSKMHPVDSIEIINGTSPICESIYPGVEEVGFNNFTQYPESKTIALDLPEAFTDSTESIFDFDNDGKLDRVLTVEKESGYMQGNAMLIQFGKSSKKLVVDDGPLLNEHSMIAACQLGTNQYKIEECPPLSGQKADESGFEMKVAPGEHSVYFRARYLSLYPFQYKNSNYVGIESYSEDTDNYIAVIKPLPNRMFEQTCLIRRVKENY